jgi:hypothetical protein
MADQDITYDDVAAAAAGLQADGQPVTLEAVRGIVDGGSPHAVYKHLSAWRATNAKPAAVPEAALPASIVADLAAWARQFADDAGAAGRAALAQSDADRDALLAAGDALEAQSDALRDELAERDETIERLNAELRNARQVAMDALVSKAKDQLAIDGKEAQLTALRAEIERNVASQAAESDRRLAAEMELVGATTARSALEAENAELRAQLQAARKR